MQCIFFNCVHVFDDFYRVQITLCIPACVLTRMLFTIFASLHAHVIRETKSCIYIDGSWMLMNLQSRREGVQNDKMMFSTTICL